MHEPLTIEESTLGPRIVVAVAGEVDLASIDEFRTALARAEQSRPRAIWIDLTEVEFMDSTGLTALVLAHRLLDAPVRRLALICPDGPVRRILEISGIDRVMPVHATRDEACIFS
jgi:anti-sigma B factor antagonist